MGWAIVSFVATSFFLGSMIIWLKATIEHNQVKLWVKQNAHRIMILDDQYVKVDYSYIGHFNSRMILIDFETGGHRFLFYCPDTWDNLNRFQKKLARVYLSDYIPKIKVKEYTFRYELYSKHTNINSIMAGKAKEVSGLADNPEKPTELNRWWLISFFGTMQDGDHLAKAFIVHDAKTINEAIKQVNKFILTNQITFLDKTA